MRFKTKLAATGLLLSTMGMAGTAFAGASGNIGVGSDYLWRGQTQTNHEAAVSGGLDYAHDSGVYVGTWTSNVSSATFATTADTEIDFYAGFSKEFAGVGIDIGGIYYAYPHVNTGWENFYEGYVSLSYSIVSASVYYDPDNKNIYGSGSIDYEVAKGLSIGVSGGYNKPDTGDSLIHYGLTLSKSLGDSDASFMISDTDTDGANEAPTMVVSWSKSFDL